MYQEQSCHSVMQLSCLPSRLTWHCRWTGMLQRWSAIAVITHVCCVISDHCWHSTSQSQSVTASSCLDSTTQTHCCTVHRPATPTGCRLLRTLARAVCQAPRSASATELRLQLHWLPVWQRISYKLAVITYKTNLTKTLAYLSDIIRESSYTHSDAIC